MPHWCYYSICVSYIPTRSLSREGHPEAVLSVTQVTLSAVARIFSVSMARCPPAPLDLSRQIWSPVKYRPPPRLKLSIICSLLLTSPPFAHERMVHTSRMDLSELHNVHPEQKLIEEACTNVTTKQYLPRMRKGALGGSWWQRWGTILQEAG